MARALKVFRTTIGFHEVVVAAPSQAAALKAWDVRENLFQQGMAAPTDDPGAVQAALAQPGVVLRRPIGAADAFAVEPALPQAPDAPPKPPPRAARKFAPAPAPKPAPPPPPDRGPLDAAQAALAQAQAEHDRAAKALAVERAELERRAAELERAFAPRKAALDRALAAARRTYRAAGGPDGDA